MAITNDQGDIVQRYGYEAFGQLTASDPTFDNFYTYTGREYDKETGLYYYRARYYDAMEGRFISKDPIGFRSGTTNLYSYVGNNPIRYIDPWGENQSIWDVAPLNREVRAYEKVGKKIVKNTPYVIAGTGAVLLLPVAPEAWPFIASTGSKLCTAGASYYTTAMVATGTPAGQKALSRTLDVAEGFFSAPSQPKSIQGAGAQFIAIFRDYQLMP